jgi:hypothetical protein
MDEDQNNNAQDQQGQPDQGQNKNNELDNARTRASQALAPLLSSLDTDPQDKFEMSLNAIRLTSDPSLVNAALDTALTIEDPTERATALMDLINEINYLQQED